MDLGLTTVTGDIDIFGIKLVERDEELQQRLSVGLTINLGEFFTHVNYGLPWLRNGDYNNDIQYFLGSDDEVTPQYIASTIDDYLLTIDKIAEVESTYEFNRRTRKLTYIPKIVGQDGNEVNFPPYTLQI